MSWEDGVLLGEYTIASFGESPNVAVESRLSWILEDSPPGRYSLSDKACLGILRRAEKRGKELPKELKLALESQAAGKNLQQTRQSHLKGTESENPTEEAASESLGGASFTLNSTEQHAVAYGISSYESNGMKSANPNSGIYKAESSRTLDFNGGNPACNQGGMAIVTAVDVYNQSVSGDVAASVTAAVGGANTSGPKLMAVDVRNGAENECNGALQSRSANNIQSNNVVRQVLT